jgi:prepilin-type N-terminal cleavage/methylation domain-containing protein
MSRRSGFTLVEVMVVLAVTAMLCAVILIYNASTRETLRLFTEKARVAQLILRSKSLALSTYTGTGDAPCGYGVRIDRAARAYAIVAYRPPDCRIRSAVDTQASSFDVAEQSSFTLTPSLEFRNIGNGQDLAYVIFIAPDPVVLVADENGALITNGLGKVRMGIRGKESDAIVSVNAAGQITY